MAKRRTNLKSDFEEINVLENFIAETILDDSFLNINTTLTDNVMEEYKFFHIEQQPFISINKKVLAPYVNTISEEKFFNIIGLKKKGLSKKSGKYQESLYSHYIRAIAEEDNGYIEDVLNKAIVFENNLNYIKKLTKNKKFMKEWRKNFRDESPLEIFKNSGNLKLINVINEQIKE